MRRIAFSLASVAALILAAVAPVAAAGRATCSELFGYPHGYHVVAD